jgi:hypothetical protein
MTLSPVDSFDVEKVDGPPYKVDSRCCSPLCQRWADHAHHLFRRSRQGEAKWVRLPDGTVTGNLVPLCARCHDLITGVGNGHVHAIRFHEDEYWFANVMGSESGQVRYVLVAPLTWQPPRPGKEDQQVLNACPTCGTVKKKKVRQPARKRKTWTVKVPADEQEDGARVMDDFVDALAYEFGFDPDGGALTRYHTLARACAFALLHKHEIPREAKED